jgi:hypothetical protein
MSSGGSQRILEKVLTKELEDDIINKSLEAIKEK